MNEHLKRINAECFSNVHKEGKQIADAVIKILGTQTKKGPEAKVSDPPSLLNLP